MANHVRTNRVLGVVVLLGIFLSLSSLPCLQIEPVSVASSAVQAVPLGLEAISKTEQQNQTEAGVG